MREDPNLRYLIALVDIVYDSEILLRTGGCIIKKQKKRVVYDLSLKYEKRIKWNK